MICTLVVFFSQYAFPNEEMNFVPIPAGEFIMGSPKDEKHRDIFEDNENQVLVKLTNDFEMQTTEVTQSQWFEVMGKNPARYRREEDCRDEHQVVGKIKLCPNHPVERVSWNDVQDFITELNRQRNDGYTYRLPTEAEWEYATRAGTTTAYFFGDDPSNLGAYGCYRVKGVRANGTHKVGQKRPNPWGLYDVHGNVWEFVQDHYRKDLPGETNPLQNSGYNRVVRGGSWYNFAEYSRSAIRGNLIPHGRYYSFGFRLVRE